MKRNAKLLGLDPSSNTDRIRASLSQVTGSEIFLNADRLRSFLTYVVEEAIGGRSKLILGKTIAEDVYFRISTDDTNRDNLVRVDAGRLRRKLAEYYDTTGVDDQIRIHMDSGGYIPWFEDCSADGITTEKSRSNFSNHRRYALVGGSVAIIGLVALSFFYFQLDQTAEPTASVTESARMLERKALSAKSTATVQAANFCDHAKGLLFPVASIDNQKLASDIFRKAISTDPDFVCGYAGLAHSLATSAILTPPGDKRNEYSQDAVNMGKKAVELAPRSGWSHSGAAWASYASGDTELALEQSALAASLAPLDGNVLDFRGVTLVVSGRFKDAYDVTHSDRPRETGSYRFAHRNIHAVASFHIEEYSEAIQSLNFAIRNGDPVSALTLVFLTASHQALGNYSEARAALKQMKENWPGFRADLALNAFYSRPEYAEAVISRLAEAGWTASK